MLKQRLITAVVALPILIAAVWFAPWFTVLATLVGALGAIEFYRLVAKAKVPPISFFGVAIVVLFVLSGDAGIQAMIEPYFDPAQAPLIIFTAAAILPLIWLVISAPKTESFARWAWTLAGAVYVGWLLSYLVALRGVEGGRNWVFFALLTTFASDSAAYFFGRARGRTKLAPAISPAKTWEGAVAGAVAALIISLVFLPGNFFGVSNPLYLSELTVASALLLGCLVSVFGQCGDLIESLFKRNMNAKDSGVLFPGHGGVLDRVDSVVFAGIVVYYFVWLTR